MAEQLTYNSPDGATMGKSATEKISFYGVTTITQPTNAAQAALTLTTYTKASAFGFKTSAGFLAAIAQLENIRASLVLLGLLKGS